METRNHRMIDTLLRSILANLFLLVAFTSVEVKAGDNSFTFDNVIGNADYLLGSKLLDDASYGTSSFTFSSILSDKLRAYVDVSHMQIYPYAQYSSNDGEVGVQLRYLDIQDNQIYGGLYAFLNRYHDDYSYFNSNGYGLYLKWKHYFKTTQLIISGYDLNFNQFEEVEEASNTDHELYLTYNQSFQTRTSINLRNSIAFQNFWIDSYDVEQIPDNQLLRSELRVSQSIGQKMGFTGWLGYQSLLNDSASLLNWQDAINNPFIDRFRWTGASTSFRLNYKMNTRNTLKLSYSLRGKDYLDVPVYAFDFENQEYVIEDEAYVDLGIDRSDENMSVQFNWSVILDRSVNMWVPGIELVLNSGWTVNSSNDPLYDYASRNYSVTLNINN